nr:isoprenylcysteine carboxylmethyltransferase family protein [Rhodanobacter sp. MP1X3]
MGVPKRGAVIAVIAKSILHNIGVLLVSLLVAYLGAYADSLLGIASFASVVARIAGCSLLALGFFVRTWAAVHFYQHGLRVVSLRPQAVLITSGPYRFSRNPLYLGGNVFMFFGAALLLGSVTALAITALHLPLIDRFIRREEVQLEQEFGEAFVNYAKRTRRWL